MSELKIVVSVCMITYNHENYISEAIEGVLMQQTTFPIELIIGEDYSTDSTRKICLDYKAKYPDKIHLLLQEKNLGISENNLQTIKACTGKYIALCEGDDYWIDPYKLQKQVDFLETNVDYSYIHTNGFRDFDGKLENWKEWADLQGDVSKTFYYGTIIKTCSVLLRQSYFEEYLKLNKFCKAQIIGDWPLFAFYSTKGKLGYLSDQTCVYRYNPNSVSSTQSKGNFLKYALDIIEVKRYLRDYLFKGELDEIFSESTLIADSNYYKLKNAFDRRDFKLAKLLASTKNEQNLKSKRLAAFTKNLFLFYLAGFIRKVRQNKFI